LQTELELRLKYVKGLEFHMKLPQAFSKHIKYFI